mgnify:CR=1 FL=1
MVISLGVSNDCDKAKVASSSPDDALSTLTFNRGSAVALATTATHERELAARAYNADQATELYWGLGYASSMAAAKSQPDAEVEEDDFNS